MKCMAVPANLTKAQWRKLFTTEWARRGLVELDADSTTQLDAMLDEGLTVNEAISLMIETELED